MHPNARPEARGWLLIPHTRGRDFNLASFFTFHLLDKPWSQVSPLLPPGSCLKFLSRIGFSNPNARRYVIECC